MCYKGYVQCRCFQDGRTSVPPFSEELQWSEEGFHFDTQSGDKSIPLFKKQAELETWKKTACAHFHMEFASAVIANDMGLDGFRNYLSKNGGIAQYPKTTELISRVGGDPVLYKEADSYWKELQDLKKRAQLTSTLKLVLREKDSHKIIMIGDYEDETFFAALNNGHIFLLKDEAFHILEQNPSEEKSSSLLFKANSFYTQELNAHQVVYFKEDGERITSIRGLGPSPARHTKKHYTVTTETFTNYTYWKTLLEGLEKLLEATLQTHNAIVWERV